MFSFPMVKQSFRNVDLLSVEPRYPYHAYGVIGTIMSYKLEVSAFQPSVSQRLNPEIVVLGFRPMESANQDQ